TDAMPQGIAALIGFNYEADFETNCKVMTAAAQSIQSAEITVAVRSVQIGPLRVREGDYLGIVNGHLAIAEEDMVHVISETLKRMKIEQMEILTLYFGEGITNQEAEDLARLIKGWHSQLEIQVVNGGQAHYAYIISAE